MQTSTRHFFPFASSEKLSPTSCCATSEPKMLHLRTSWHLNPKSVGEWASGRETGKTFFAKWVQIPRRSEINHNWVRYLEQRKRENPQLIRTSIARWLINSCLWKFSGEKSCFFGNLWSWKSRSFSSFENLFPFLIWNLIGFVKFFVSIVGESAQISDYPSFLNFESSLPLLSDSFWEKIFKLNVN